MPSGVTVKRRRSQQKVEDEEESVSEMNKNFVQFSTFSLFFFFFNKTKYNINIYDNDKQYLCKLLQISYNQLQEKKRIKQNQKQKYIYIKGTYITICMHTHIVYRVLSIVKFENRKQPEVKCKLVFLPAAFSLPKPKNQKKPPPGTKKKNSNCFRR